MAISYSPRGENTEIQEASTNSGSYYDAKATYWANGMPHALTGTNGYAATYNLDGEGRVNGVLDGSNNPFVSSVTYQTTQPSGALTGVTFGSGDFDTYNYDSQTGRMTGYQSNVGTSGQAVVGALTWNQNGTLQKLLVLGRTVEVDSGTTYKEIAYAATGAKAAIMNGQSIVTWWAPLPGGGVAAGNATTRYYRHGDWLGSSRLSTISTQTVYYDGAYAPFGESYSETGTTDRSFTGQNQDTVPKLYDFPYRRYSPIQGRWVSPDPAGMGAVDPSNPQSWNRYAYVANNPLSYIDPLGLRTSCDDKGNCHVDVNAGSGPPTPGQYDGSVSLVNICDMYPGVGICQNWPDAPVGPDRNHQPPNVITTVPNVTKSCAEQLNDMLNDINAVRGSGSSGLKGLAQRWNQIFTSRGYQDPGHANQFLRRQKNLQTKIDDYRNSGCGDPPTEVADWATKTLASPWPTPPSWVGPAAITGAAVCAIVVPGCFEAEAAAAVVF